MVLVDILGWIAVALTLAAFSMRTMLPLRIAAIGANVFFIAYGALAEVYPNLVLHLLLLPFNLYRLSEILRMTRRVRGARSGDFDVAQLLPARTLTDGSTIFRKGDAPDNLYYLVSGRVRLLETGFTIEAGEVFGEIAFFSDEKQRTLTAVCDGPCKVVSVDESGFMQLYYQNPAFGMYIVRLISRRLLQGMSQKPEAFAPVTMSAKAGK